MNESSDNIWYYNINTNKNMAVMDQSNAHNITALVNQFIAGLQLSPNNVLSLESQQEIQPKQ